MVFLHVYNKNYNDVWPYFEAVLEEFPYNLTKTKNNTISEPKYYAFLSEIILLRQPEVARWWTRGKGSLAKLRTSIDCCQPNLQLHDMKASKVLFYMQCHYDPNFNSDSLNCFYGISKNKFCFFFQLLSFAFCSPSVWKISHSKKIRTCLQLIYSNMCFANANL